LWSGFLLKIPYVLSNGCSRRAHFTSETCPPWQQSIVAIFFKESGRPALGRIFLAALVQGQPQYFDLLWDHELDELRGILEDLSQRRDEILADWHRLYTLHFGIRRSLAESQFMELLGSRVVVAADALLKRNIQAFTAQAQEIGEDLSQRKVPFSEVVASMHLFEESATAILPPLQPDAPKTYQSFDKLSHCVMMVLADSYFRAQTAMDGLRIHELEAAAANLPAELRTRFHGIVGSSAAMRELYRRIEMAGQTRGTMLVVGESGTGKELVARAIHGCGGDRESPFVALNCAALPKDLIESELFGYKRGAFSGANSEYLGLFRAAERGTLFLDEITEMSPDTQSKLLRAIQERRVRPVGATIETAVEVRLIASTNRDPEEAMKAGHLRHDLYYRLQANVLRVPPLRERLEDVAALTQHFIAWFNEKMHRTVRAVGIEAPALDAMMHYSWPGNVRELSNAIEGAFTFGDSPVILLSELPPAILGETTLTVAPETAPASGALATFAEVERDLIKRALDHSEGNKARAAKVLKISRKKLYAKIIKYNLG
jgi:DNA-binding NtrC family response regulator